MAQLPTFEDVQAAAHRLQGHALHTPVMRSRTANTLLGGALFFKCENLQRTGAFKFRGAFSRLLKYRPPTPALSEFQRFG